MSCKNENQLNPTFGNVVFVHIEMTRYSAPFPVGLARDVEVNLITRLGARLPQEKTTINIDDSIDVEIDTVPSAGVYGIEVRGTYGGYAWRCFAPCCLNYTYPTEELDNDATVTGDTYDLSMDVTMNAPNAAQDAAIEEHNENPASHPYILGLIDDVNASLANYYTKSQTYSQSEVNNLIQSISQFTYEIVTKLPTASASTMNKIYLVNTPPTPFYTEYITIEEGEYGGQYRWETIGDTSIALRDYLTAAETNTAINNALTNYYTKLETNLRLADKANVTEIAGYNTGSTIRVRGSNGVVIEGNNGVNGTNYSSVSATKTGVSIVGQSLKWNNADLATKAYVQTYSQEKLESGTNIKTINNESILGDGNIDIEGGASSWDEISDKPTFATVATSGSYDDLSDKPTIPDVTGKADKVASATNGHLAGLNASGNLTDSGIVPSTLVYQGANQGTVPSVDFDPQADTVHITEQSLSSAQMQQARTNIGAAGVNDIIGIPIVNHGTSDKGTSSTSYSIAPNTLHVWGEVDALYLSLTAGEVGYAQEYMIQFTSGSTATTLSLPNTLKWINGVTPSDIEADHVYQISIMNGIGVIGGVDESSSSS